MSGILGGFRLQEPCLDMRYPIRITGSLQSPSARVFYRIRAQHPGVGILYKIHASGPPTRSKTSLQEPCLWILCRILAQDPCFTISLQDPLLRVRYEIHAMSQDTLKDPWLRIACKIHVSGSSIQDRCFPIPVLASMSLGPYTRSARSMFPVL